MTQKIYIKNPYLTELHAKIVSNEYRNGKFYIKLNRTIFYPHMAGGQPRDKGKINNIPVVDVYEKKGEIIHVLQDNPLDNDVNLSIDWNTRLEHMQSHTGQHILSASFHKILNVNTISFHIGNNTTYIDVDSSYISNKDLERVESFANYILFSNFKINSYYVDKYEASNLPLRNSPSVESNIRIVEIDNLDFSPCGGTHHRRTAEVGIIKILKTSKIKDYIRIEFNCGYKALKDYRSKNHIVNNISQTLAISNKDIIPNINKLIETRESLDKENNLITSKLLDLKQRELEYHSANYKGFIIISDILNDYTFDNIRNLVLSLTDNDDTIVLLGLEKSDKSQIIIGQSSNIDIGIKQIFNDLINNMDGKGGGNNNVYQGGTHKENVIYETLKLGLEKIKTNIDRAVK